MSTWTTPITWTNAAVTASQMNAEIRDHANFLKGSLDLISNSTAADTGTTMYLSITRAAAGDTGYRSLVSGDTNPRFNADADGRLEWGPGSGAADTNLYRSAADTLSTEDLINFAGSRGIHMQGNVIEFLERSDPAAAASNEARLYARDNGAGKTQLVVLFSSGAVQVIATQP